MNQVPRLYFYRLPGTMWTGNWKTFLHPKRVDNCFRSSNDIAHILFIYICVCILYIQFPVEQGLHFLNFSLGGSNTTWKSNVETLNILQYYSYVILLQVDFIKKVLECINRNIACKLFYFHVYSFTSLLHSRFVFDKRQTIFIFVDIFLILYIMHIYVTPNL